MPGRQEYRTEHSRNPAVHSQEDRVRAVFGGSSGALPPVDRQWLKKYRDYLAGRLSLPFCAFYHEPVNPLEDISHALCVLEILDPSEHASSDGLVCRATDETGKFVEAPLVDLEVDPQSPNFTLLEDYWYWAWNGRRDG